MKTNCQNCGAALSLKHFQDRLHCTYCETIHIPSLREDELIEKVYDISSELHCPLCKNNLSHAKLGQWRFLYCADCRGLLLEGQDLINIILYCRVSSENTNRLPIPIDPIELERQIHCPDCKEAMSAHPYYGPGDFVIDSCGSCMRVWLDSGELCRSSTVKWGGSLWR